MFVLLYNVVVVVVVAVYASELYGFAYKCASVCPYLCTNSWLAGVPAANKYIKRNINNVVALLVLLLLLLQLSVQTR